MIRHLKTATGAFVKTLPFVVVELAIGAVFALLAVVYLGLVGWLAVEFLLGDGGWGLLVVGAVMLIAFVSFAYVWRLIRRYVLYLVRAGHVAVVAHVITEGEVPDNQLRYATSQVSEYFLSASGLAGVELLLEAVLGQLTRSVTRLGGALPASLPGGLRALATVVRRSVALAVGHLDDAVLAYMFVDRDPNRWRSARDGVVLYGKCWKPVLATTLLVVFGTYVLWFVLLTVFAPLAVALDALPTGVELVSWLVVFGLVAVVHTGVVKPWVKTVVITTFLLESRGERPDSETVAWIEARSDRFAELTERAENDDPIDGEDPSREPARSADGETA